MNSSDNILETIDALHDRGRYFVERPYEHGASVESVFDRCQFDKWRRQVNDLLFMIGGCEDLYYQRFSKEVTRPHIKDLEAGLRILAAVRDDVSCADFSGGYVNPGARPICDSRSASYH